MGEADRLQKVVHPITQQLGQVAALLKSVTDPTPPLTDEQIMHRVYQHFGSLAVVFPDQQWIGFVKSLEIIDRSSGKT